MAIKNRVLLKQFVEKVNRDFQTANPSLLDNFGMPVNLIVKSNMEKWVKGLETRMEREIQRDLYRTLMEYHRVADFECFGIRIWGNDGPNEPRIGSFADSLLDGIESTRKRQLAEWEMNKLFRHLMPFADLASNPQPETPVCFHEGIVQVDIPKTFQRGEVQVLKRIAPSFASMMLAFTTGKYEPDFQWGRWWE